MVQLNPSNEENFEDPNAENGWYYAFELFMKIIPSIGHLIMNFH